VRAAKRLGVASSELSRILRGDFRHFSIAQSTKFVAILDQENSQHGGEAEGTERG
jgi:predicted XRE-type DNA-binding protein